MERLTERQMDYSKYDIHDRCYVGSQWNCEAPHCMSCPIKKMYIKMQEIEDLEEQGLLVKPPCKVGDVVWCITYDETAELEVSGYTFLADNNECVIVSSDPIGYCGSISQYHIEETLSNYDTSLYVFPIKDAFPTESEAKLALKERVANGTK